MKHQATQNKKGNAFYLWMGMLLPALTMLAGFLVIGAWPFGDGTILKVDSLHQYLPFFTDFHQKLRSGDSLFYSFSGGLGYDFWSTYAYYLASPLNWLIVLVSKPHVCDFMDFMIVLKVSACGGIFSWYLHKRRPSAAFLPLVMGTMYAMGNFYIGYNFNIMWLDSMAVTPLIMYGIERLVKGKGGWVYGLSLFYALWCNYYIGFMLCIFSCLYLLVCFVCIGREEKSARGFRGGLLICLRFFWYSLLAGGLGAVVLLPAYRSLTGSESMLSNSFPAKLKFYTDFLSMYMSHFINAKPINISNSQVGFNAYCGTVVPVLVVCYALAGRIRLRERIAHLLLTGFLFAGVTVNYLNYMWHGFHTQNGLPNRFVFLYVLMILLLAFDVLCRIPELGIWRILFSGIVIIALTIWTVMARETGENWAGGTVSVLPVIMTAIYLALLILAAAVPGQKIIAIILGALMLTEAAGHGIYGMCENGRVTRSIYLKDQASYQALIGRTGDEDFFRSEIDSQRMRNVTMFAGGHSMVLFNSTMPEAVTEFCDRLGIEARTNKNGYNGLTRLINDVFGIRYVLASIGKGNTLYQFPQVDADDNLKLYKNENALSLGFVVNEEIRQWDTSEGTPIGVQNSFAKLAAGVEDLYMLDRSVDAADGENVQVKVPVGKQVYLYLPERIDNFILNTPEFHREYATYNDHLYAMNSLGDDRIGDFTCELKASQDTVRVNIYTCPDETCQQVHDILAASQLENVKAFGAKVSATLDSHKDGILLLTIPYDEDWHIWLDDEPVQPEVIGGALIGLPVSQGAHVLRMRFVPGGFKAGLAISVASAVLMLLSVWIQQRRSRRAPAAEAEYENTGEADDMMNQPDRAAGELMRIAGSENVFRNEPMSAHTTFRIGGPADVFVAPADETSLSSVISYLRGEQIPFYVIGNGSNLLVGDGGFRGVIVQVGRNLSGIETEGNTICAGAGAMLSSIARTAWHNGLTGLEFASGIPGTLGGAVVMNAGAYGGEMKDVITRVRVLTPEGSIQDIPAAEMDFGYRTSCVTGKGYIVLGAVFALREGNPDQILERMQELKEQRTSKQPLDKPSAGSTFKRPEGYFAGKLIMDAGLKGYAVGGAAVSEKHAGFVVNNGGATARDVTELIEYVQAEVERQFGVRLECEVRMIGEFV